MAYIPIDPKAEFDTNMEALKTTDAAHADVFNEPFKQLLENDYRLNLDKEPLIPESAEDTYLNGKKKFVNLFESVRGALLTGFTSVTAAAVTASDTVLGALEKLQAQVEEKVSKSSIANNLTTTKAGSVADARTVKTLQETKAPMANPAFTGIPTVPTAAKGTNNTQAASTAFVQTALSDKADLNAPAFTGYPTAPTPPGGTNSDVIATTAFVKSQISTKANLASPAFTGAPTAPTATSTSNNTQIATTAFVKTAVSEAISKCRMEAKPASDAAVGSDSKLYVPFQTQNYQENNAFTAVYHETYGWCWKSNRAMKAMVTVTLQRLASGTPKSGNKSVQAFSLYESGTTSKSHGTFNRAMIHTSLDNLCWTFFASIPANTYFIVYYFAASGAGELIGEAGSRLTIIEL